MMYYYVRRTPDDSCLLSEMKSHHRKVESDPGC